VNGWLHLLAFAGFVFGFLVFNEAILLPYQTPQHPNDIYSMQQRPIWINAVLTGVSFLLWGGGCWSLLNLYELTRSDEDREVEVKRFVAWWHNLQWQISHLLLYDIPYWISQSLHHSVRLIGGRYHPESVQGKKGESVRE